MTQVLEPESKVLQGELMPATNGNGNGHNPADKNELAKIVNESGLDMSDARSLQAAFNDLFDQAQKWRETALAIKVTAADQDIEMKLARNTRLELKRIRVDAEKTRKALKEDSLRKGKAIDGIANVLKFLIAPAEKHLEEQENFVARMEAERKAKLQEEREAAMAPFVDPDLPAADYSNMPEEQFSALLVGTKAQFEQRQEAARKAEEERIAQEKAEAEEAERIRAENARLKAEADAAAEELRKEREAAEAERAKAQAEREAREEEARLEREAAEMVAQRERKKQQELEAQREAERQAEAKRVADLQAQLEAERKAAAEQAAKTQPKPVQHFRSAGNGHRAAIAKDALDAIAEGTGMVFDDAECAVGDLLTNLMHFCNQHDVDFDACCDTARKHFEAEVAEEAELATA